METVVDVYRTGYRPRSSSSSKRFLRFYTFFLLFLGVFASSFTVAQQISPSAPANNAISNFTWEAGKTTEILVSCTGNATLTNNPSEGLGAMCLTPPGDKLGLTSGRCLYNKPVQLSTNTSQSKSPAPSFSTMFSFSTQIYPTQQQGQGFTFFLAPDNTTLGSPDYFLGWLNSSTENDQSGHNFAVEFDIFANSEVDDIDNNHVGVNVNSLKSKHFSSLNSSGIDLATYNAVKLLYAWIDYNGSRIDLRVSIDTRKPCDSIIHASLDLGDVLLDTMYVGFSSSSGDHTDSQTTVYSWSFMTNGEATNIFGDVAYCGATKAKLSWILILGVVAGVLFVALVVFILLLHHRTKMITALERDIKELQYLDNGAHEFPYKELLLATKRFSATEILGQGASGTVYKGTLSGDRIRRLKGEEATKDNSVVAVKRINKKSTEGVKEYVAEVKIIGRFRHVNLVRVLGWCHEKGELLLVYEYMPNGNVYDFMFKGSGKAQGTSSVANMVVDSTRIVSELGDETGDSERVAAALVFLHEECEQRVVHRDVKSSNVMLDRDFHARLGDFGLARSQNKNEEYHSTFVAGTIGYLAPECFTTGYATAKSDVYSFGVLAMEIATGRRPTYGNEGLARWLWELQSEGRVMEAVDVNLGGNYSKEEMEKLLKVAIFCCLPDPEARPTMRQVQTVLQGESSILLWPLPSPPVKVTFSHADFDRVPTDSEVDMSLTDYGSSDSFLPYTGKDDAVER